MEKNGAQVSVKDSTDYIYDDIEYNLQNVYWQEALHVYEKLVKMDISEEERGAAIFTMIMIYKRTGDYKKAKAFANEQNSIVLSKEVLLPNAAVWEEKDKY